MLKSTSLGFLGFGEVAFAFARELKGKGCSVYAYDHRINPADPMGSLKLRRAKEIGVNLVNELPALIGEVRYLFSTVTPAAAEQVARQALIYISTEQIFLDLNSTAPVIKKQLSEEFSEKGVLYIDGALMNSPVDVGLSAPIFVSGCSKGVLVELDKLFNLSWVGEKAGQAAAIKMCQSIVTKGYQALLWEQALLAKAWDVERFVVDTLSGLFDGRSFADWQNYALTSSVIHASRRAEEMEMVIQTLRAAGLPTIMAEATKNTLDWLAAKNLRTYFQGERPKSTAEVIDLVRKGVG